MKSLFENFHNHGLHLLALFVWIPVVCQSMIGIAYIQLTIGNNCKTSIGLANSLRTSLISISSERITMVTKKSMFPKEWRLKICGSSVVDPSTPMHKTLGYWSSLLIYELYLGSQIRHFAHRTFLGGKDSPWGISPPVNVEQAASPKFCGHNFYFRN